MQLNFKALLPIQLRDKCIFVRFFYFLLLASLCLTILLLILHLSMYTSADNSTSDFTPIMSSSPLQSTPSIVPTPSVPIDSHLTTAIAQPTSATEQDSTNSADASTTNSVEYPAWYSYLITTSSIMNTIIASVYAFGISTSVKTQHGILYADLFSRILTRPCFLSVLRIVTFIVAIVLVVCACFRCELGMQVSWVCTVLITILLMILQSILETGKFGKRLNKRFYNMLDKDFRKAYEQYYVPLKNKEEFYKAVNIQKMEMFYMEAIRCIDIDWCNAHIIRVTNLGLNSVPQSICNSPDTEFLVDQIQGGFSKMIEFGFFRIFDNNDSIEANSQATYFMGQYITMIYTILHRAYICDMNGKHYHLVYAIQNDLRSKQANLENAIRTTKSEDVSVTSGVVIRSKTSGSADVDHPKSHTLEDEYALSPEDRNFISFILAHYYIQAFFFFECTSDLLAVYNGYNRLSNSLADVLNAMGESGTYGNKIRERHNTVLSVVKRMLLSNEEKEDIDPPHRGNDRWFQVALSCHKAMR